MTERKMAFAGIFATIAVVGIILFFTFFVRFQTISGNEVGVRETWTGGVDENPYPPRTYVYVPMTTTWTPYDVSTQVFVMNDKGYDEDSGIGRTKDSYQVQSAEGQDMFISLSVQYSLDRSKIVELHKSLRGEKRSEVNDAIVERIIRPVVMRIVKDSATQREAIQAYSGPGLVSLQQDIETKLSDMDGELRRRGIVVENFVIEHIRLDPDYISEITQRQVASQRVLRANEETRAAEAEALRAQAEAQADANRRIVEAERDKRVGILEAEKKAETVRLAAEAERDARLLEAQGIVAMGEAEAEARRLLLTAYAVPGASEFVRMEIAKSMADAHKNIRGYLPSDMTIYTLGNNFDNAIERIVGVRPLTEVADSK